MTTIVKYPALPVALVVSLTLGVTASAWAASNDMHGMDHSQMPGMDHSQMQGMDSMQGMETMESSPTTSRTPIPELTAADRAAVLEDHGGHAVHDSAINSFFLIDQLEWQDADDGSALSWDASGWIGGDIDRLWLRSEGERTNGKTEEAELQALWGHAVSPWWDVVAGVRQDFKPSDSQTWAAFGVQGMALYNFEAEATAFIGEGGQSAVRLEGDYDILLTNRLILQPTAEANFYGKNDPDRGIGSGLSDTEVGVRLRYEIRREFAPYIGVTWNRAYGNTADYVRGEGEDRSEARLVLGVRMWF
jgi:copper resistance protein B